MSERPEIIIGATIDDLVTIVAERWVQAMVTATESRGQASLVLAGGSTPSRLYQLLTRAPYRQRLPWQKMHFFWGDERLVPFDHPHSNYWQAYQLLLGPAGVPASNIWRMKGELLGQIAADDYSRQLAQAAPAGQAWPRFDWVLLGLGADGHTASLFPGARSDAEVSAPVIAVTASYQGRPAGRITLTPTCLNAARKIAFLVTGAEKAPAVAEYLATDEPDPVRWPAARIQPSDGEITWFLDRAAAAQLPPQLTPARFPE